MLIVTGFARFYEEVGVEECRGAFRELSDEAFQLINYRAVPAWSMPLKSELKGRFDSDALKRGIKKIVRDSSR